MYRLHIHVSVPELDEAIEFYSALFAASPTSIKDGYAKWMVDDPGLNFAVSVNSSAGRTGLHHVGIQAETEEEFHALAQRLLETKRHTVDEHHVHCCYAIGDKSTVVDPAGLEWETFITHGESPHWATRQVEPQADHRP
jgi:catechol 2,3-dioxygenase-like lactoylglutathione lyase family enzyme